MEPANPEDFGNIFKYTFLYEHSDGEQTFIHKARGFQLQTVIQDFFEFLHSEEVGFLNPVTVILHDGLYGDEVIECKPPSVE